MNSNSALAVSGVAAQEPKMQVFIEASRMYEELFHLKRRPFSATPDPACFFQCDSNMAVIGELVDCVDRCNGIAVLTASAGMGKTLICRRLASVLSHQYETVFLGSGQFPSCRAMLQAILFEMGVEYSRKDEDEIRLGLRSALKILRPEKEALVVIIDEAHLYAPALLEELRTLSEVAEDGRPLVRVILVGQIEFEEQLAGREYEAINQRIGAHVFLQSFSHTESLNYLHHRLKWAGGHADAALTPQAQTLIARASGGVPRCLNQLADHTLLLAFASNAVPATDDRVREALEDLKQLPLHWNDINDSVGNLPPEDDADFDDFDSAAISSAAALAEFESTSGSDSHRPSGSATRNAGGEHSANSAAQESTVFEFGGADVVPKIETAREPAWTPQGAPQDTSKSKHSNSQRASTPPGGVGGLVLDLFAKNRTDRTQDSHTPVKKSVVSNVFGSAKVGGATGEGGSTNIDQPIGASHHASLDGNDSSDHQPAAFDSTQGDTLQADADFNVDSNASTIQEAPAWSAAPEYDSTESMAGETTVFEFGHSDSSAESLSDGIDVDMWNSPSDFDSASSDPASSWHEQADEPAEHSGEETLFETSVVCNEGIDEEMHFDHDTIVEAPEAFAESDPPAASNDQASVVATENSDAFETEIIDDPYLRIREPQASGVVWNLPKWPKPVVRPTRQFVRSNQITETSIDDSTIADESSGTVEFDFAAELPDETSAATPDVIAQSIHQSVDAGQSSNTGETAEAIRADTYRSPSVAELAAVFGIQHLVEHELLGVTFNQISRQRANDASEIAAEEIGSDKTESTSDAAIWNDHSQFADSANSAHDPMTIVANDGDSEDAYSLSFEAAADQADGETGAVHDSVELAAGQESTLPFKSFQFHDQHSSEPDLYVVGHDAEHDDSYETTYGFRRDEDAVSAVEEFGVGVGGGGDDDDDDDDEETGLDSDGLRHISPDRYLDAIEPLLEQLNSESGGGSSSDKDSIRENASRDLERDLVESISHYSQDIEDEIGASILDLCLDTQWTIHQNAEEEVDPEQFDPADFDIVEPELDLPTSRKKPVADREPKKSEPEPPPIPRSRRPLSRLFSDLRRRNESEDQ